MKLRLFCLFMMSVPPLAGADLYRGGMVTPPIPKPALALTATDGTRFDLASRTEGDVTLLFFGYTHCPDVCPMHMAYLASALKKLPPPVRARIRLVFITTDPARDDPKSLRTWLDHFDGRFVGLTGSDAEIAAAQSAAHVPHAGKSGDGHAAFILAYTKDNLAHVIYPFGVTVEDWLHDLPMLVKEDWRLRRSE